MPLLFWVILCVLVYFLVDLIPIPDAIVSKVLKVFAVIGLGSVCFWQHDELDEAKFHAVGGDHNNRNVCNRIYYPC